jgi:hypothetical protein
MAAASSGSVSMRHCQTLAISSWRISVLLLLLFLQLLLLLIIFFLSNKKYLVLHNNSVEEGLNVKVTKETSFLVVIVRVSEL